MTGIITIKPMNPVIKPIPTPVNIILAQSNMANLFVSTALILVNTAVAKSTWRSIKIGWVNAVIKNTTPVNTIPKPVPTAKNGHKLERLGSK